MTLKSNTIKKSPDDLAIFGGKPSFETDLHVGRPNIGDRSRFLSYTNDIFDRHWLTNQGHYVHEFEKRIANIIGVKHCIAVCNATIGLEIAIRGCGLIGEVILPSMTFIATAHALQWQGIVPIFCDINPETHNIDPVKIETLITPRTTGIIGVHLWGRPCNIEALSEIAEIHNLKIIYDAAHAFYCSHDARMIGCFGEAEIFSFHATKFINTFEGGAIVTNNDTLAEKFRLMRNFGFSDIDKVISIGTNGKMNEISAAMGLASLKSLDEFIAINYRNYKLYQLELSGIPGLTLISYNEYEKNNYQYIILEFNETIADITRDQIVEILWNEKVLARRYFYPGCHGMEPYRTIYPNTGSRLPETEKMVRRLIALPTGTGVSLNDIRHICQIIRFVILNGNKIRQRLIANS